MERPVDAVTAAVLRLQIAQRAVNALVAEVIERVSADPFAEAPLPDLRPRLTERRAEVDRAVGQLIDALDRMHESSPPPE